MELEKIVENIEDKIPKRYQNVITYAQNLNKVFFMII